MKLLEVMLPVKKSCSQPERQPEGVMSRSTATGVRDSDGGGTLVTIVVIDYMLKRRKARLLKALTSGVGSEVHHRQRPTELKQSELLRRGEAPGASIVTPTSGEGLPLRWGARAHIEFSVTHIGARTTFRLNEGCT